MGRRIFRQIQMRFLQVLQDIVKKRNEYQIWYTNHSYFKERGEKYDSFP